MAAKPGKTGNTEKRPCCLLLRELSGSLSALSSPEEAEKALDTISKHCVLMQLAGKSNVKIDFSKSECYLAIHPDEAQSVLTEVEKTAAVYGELDQFADLLNKINKVLANNAKLSQMADKLQVFLKQLREGDKGEKRFGRVPDTDISKENKTQNVLGAGDLLQAHPLLKDSTQFDGMNPKDNMNPQEKPDAAENAEQLQKQLQNQPQKRHQYQPGSTAPKPRPAG